MGLTWIDHDTIEKPIEEITLGTDDAVDIQFTVETLKSANSNESSTNLSAPKMKPITKKVIPPSRRLPTSVSSVSAGPYQGLNYWRGQRP